MDFLKRIVNKLNSFFRSHAREIAFFGIGFLSSCVLWVSLVMFTSCRGLWSWDFKAESDKGKISTKVDFIESVPSVGCDGISENESVIEGGVK